MIYDTLPNIGAYGGLSPRLDMALKYIAETDFDALPDGRYELDGENVFALVSTATTALRGGEGAQRMEAHDKYLDVQFIARGEECIGVAPRAALGAEEPGNGDICFLTGACTYLPMGLGRFLVVWPQDAHAPCCAVGDTPASVRRVVVKVKI